MSQFSRNSMVVVVKQQLSLKLSLHCNCWRLRMNSTVWSDQEYMETLDR